MVLIELGRDPAGHLVGAAVGLAPLVVMPLLEVRVRARHPAPHRRVVDRLLEPLRQLDLGGAAGRVAGGDERRDLGPSGDSVLGHVGEVYVGPATIR